MSLAAKLMELRAEKKASLQVVADAVGVSKPHIWELEKGKTKNPSLDLLKKLAAYYSVSLDFLAGVEHSSEEEGRCNALLRRIDPENISESDWKVIESAVDFAMNLIEERKSDTDD